MFRGYSLSRILGWGCCKAALRSAGVGACGEVFWGICLIRCGACPRLVGFEYSARRRW